MHGLTTVTFSDLICEGVSGTLSTDVEFDSRGMTSPTLVTSGGIVPDKNVWESVHSKCAAIQTLDDVSVSILPSCLACGGDSTA